jgi:hypothetical protein
VSRAAILITLSMLAGCAHSPPFDDCEHDRPTCTDTEPDPEPATHNAGGGYIVACGHLPGMLGDDC